MNLTANLIGKFNGKNGDLLAHYVVLIRKMRESIKITQQAVEKKIQEDLMRINRVKITTYGVPVIFLYKSKI